MRDRLLFVSRPSSAYVGASFFVAENDRLPACIDLHLNQRTVTSRTANMIASLSWPMLASLDTCRPLIELFLGESDLADRRVCKC